jgi:hypothetical protein
MRIDQSGQERGPGKIDDLCIGGLRQRSRRSGIHQARAAYQHHPAGVQRFARRPYLCRAQQRRGRIRAGAERGSGGDREGAKQGARGNAHRWSL